MKSDGMVYSEISRSFDRVMTGGVDGPPTDGTTLIDQSRITSSNGFSSMITISCSEVGAPWVTVSERRPLSTLEVQCIGNSLMLTSCMSGVAPDVSPRRRVSSESVAVSSPWVVSGGPSVIEVIRGALTDAMKKWKKE